MTPQEAEIERTGKFILAMSLCVVGAIGLISYSAYHWLRDGIWVPVTLRDFTQAPRFEWLGVQQVADWLWGVPLWIFLLLIAFGFVFYLDKPKN